MPTRPARSAVAAIVLATIGALVPTPAWAEVATSVVEEVPVAPGAVLTDLVPFRLVALSWDGRTGSEPPAVEVHDEAGWQPLAVEPESVDVRPDDGTREAATDDDRRFSEPVWVDRADGIRIAEGAPVAGLAVHLARDDVRRVVASSLPAAGAAVAPDGPAVTGRSTWGAAPPTQTNSVATSVQLAVVHHTAGGNDYQASDVPAILRSIQAFHQGSRGWNDIAYNFLVDRFGGIWEGRDGGIGRPVVGAHAAGVNTGSVGVAVLGDFTSVSAPPAAVDAVADVIGWKLSLHGIDPTGSAPVTMRSDNRFAEGTTVTLPRVIGHQQAGLTTCPGRLMADLADIRARAALRGAVARGALDGLALEGRTTILEGWANDRRTTEPISVAVTVDGRRVTQARADRPRPDVTAAVPGSGPAHGFRILATVGEGDSEVCAWALEASYDAATSLGCRMVSVPRTVGPAPPRATLRVSPTEGGFARGTIEAVLGASSPDGVGSLVLAVDGSAAATAAVPGPDGTARVRFDTTTVSDGPLALRALMVDGAGRSAGSEPVRIVVDNTRPGVLVMAPTAARGGSRISVGVGANDAGEVRATFLALDDQVVGGFLGAGARSFPVTLPRTGRHRLVAATIDRAGNLAFSNQVWVTSRRR